MRDYERKNEQLRVVVERATEWRDTGGVSAMVEALAAELDLLFRTWAPASGSRAEPDCG